MVATVGQIVVRVGGLLSSLSEVSGSTDKATAVVNAKVSKSDKGKEIVDNLGESAQKIRQVVAEIR